MPRVFYRCVARVDSRHVYFLWFSNDRDGIDMTGSHVRVFDSEALLVEYSRGANHDISSEAPVFFDLDRVGDWLANPTRDTVDATLLLNVWNLIEDYLRTILDDDVEHSLGGVELYDKLFWANNLPAVTAPGKRFDPDWTIKETAELAGILTEPYNRLRAAFRTEAANRARSQSASPPGDAGDGN